jgi:uncharacterized protein
VASLTLTRVSRPIRFPVAAGAWALAWLLGTVVASGVLALRADADAGDPTVRQLAALLPVVWAVFLVMLAVVSRRHGGRGWADFRDHYALAVRPVDAVWAVAGAAAQLLVVPLVYWPLRELWPTTFSSDELERRAQELADSATGGWVIVLVVLVVIGAPLVEELVYRGLLQRSLSSVVGGIPALLIASALFAAIHFSAVEMIGLALAGLLFGAALQATGRLGASILAHVGFNIAGLVLALR